MHRLVTVLVKCGLQCLASTIESIESQMAFRFEARNLSSQSVEFRFKSIELTCSVTIAGKKAFVPSIGAAFARQHQRYAR
ncbi:hypothetical protein WL07_32585 [Burkholderia cepacia]|nr:hypothetical protein WL07_32585 [Burkholderia cepacia]